MSAITLKPAPIDPNARTRAAMRGTNDMLIEDTQGRIIVVGVDDAGDQCYLGHVSLHAIFQKGANPMALIERVRFGHIRGKEPRHD